MTIGLQEVLVGESSTALNLLQFDELKDAWRIDIAQRMDVRDVEAGAGKSLGCVSCSIWSVKKSLKREMQNICRGEVATDGDWKGKAAEWAGLSTHSNRK